MKQILSNLKFVKLGFVWILGFVIWNLLTPSPIFATNIGQFSAEVWVKPTSTISSQAILGKAEEMRIFTDASGYAGCQIKVTTWQTAATATTNALTLNSWNHVACTYDKANIKVFVNGVQVATQAQTSAPDDTANAILLGQDSSASTPYSNLTGAVDNFQFYNYARTADQITSDMNAGHPAVGSPVGSAVGYWKFDEGYLTTAHNSGNAGSAIDGTLTNTAGSNPTWTNSGKSGKALVFDGSTNWVDIPDNVGLRSSTLTISTWVFPANVNSTYQGLVVKRDNNSNNEAYALAITNGNKFFFEMKDGVGGHNVAATSTTTVANSTWYHVIGTYDGSNLKIYVNGNLEATTAWSYGVYQTTSTTKIGSYDNNGFFYKGTIDEVKIYNYALTADQVKLDMNRQSAQVLGALSDNTTYQTQAANQEYCIPGDSTSCVAPVGEWKFEEGSGNVNDSSGNGYTGTVTGTTVAPGKFGKARSFNGTSDLISLGTSSPFRQSSAITYSFWVNIPTGGGGNAMGVADVSGSGSGGVSVTTTAIQFAWTPTSPLSDRAYTATTTVSTNTWHHIVAAISFSGASSGQIYLDGVPQTTTLSAAVTTATPATSYDTTNGDDIGGRYVNSQNYFNGKIDHVRIYNYVRSAAQVAWEYNRGGPVGWWKMDECQGTVAHDSSGNGNSGTINISTGGTQTTTIGYGTCTSNAATPWYNGRTGKINYSLNFDGTDDYADSGSWNPAPTAVTIEAWINPGTTAQDGANHVIVAKGNDGLNTSFLLNNYLGDQLCMEIFTSGSLKYNCSAVGSITVSAWNHVVGVYDGNNCLVYINGVLVTGGPSVSCASGGSISGADSVWIGAQNRVGFNYYYKGKVDDVKVFNYALTATQVKGLYNNGAVNFAPASGAP